MLSAYNKTSGSIIRSIYSPLHAKRSEHFEILLCTIYVMRRYIRCCRFFPIFPVCQMWCSFVFYFLYAICRIWKQTFKFKKTNKMCAEWHRNLNCWGCWSSSYMSANRTVVTILFIFEFVWRACCVCCAYVVYFYVFGDLLRFYPGFCILFNKGWGGILGCR